MKRRTIWVIGLMLAMLAGYGEESGARANDNLTIARIKYQGGGDWYNDPEILPNLCRELNRRTTVEANEEQAIVSVEDDALFSYPILFITGHGNIRFTEKEVSRLRTYLTHGGFLYVDDDYGLDEAFRREMGKVFPKGELAELPRDHPLYSAHYVFPNGLPKIHEHDNKRPQGFGIFYEERLVVFYTYETNVSDGWADPETHEDPPATREQALRMGINIVVYALTQ